MEEASSARALDWDRLAPEIDQLLDRLDERDRELVILRCFNGGAFADIGARFGMSADAARFRVNRALEKMRSALGKRGIVSTSAALAATLGSQAGTLAPADMIAVVTKAALAEVSHAGSFAAMAARALQFMSINKAAVGIVALVGCIAGGFLMHEHSALISAEGALAASEQHYSAVLKRIADEKLALREAEAARDSALKKLASQTGVQTGGGSSDTSAANKAASMRAAIKPKAAEVNRTLSHDPAVRAALSAWIKSSFQESLGPFYKAAGLSPQQIASLEDLFLKGNINMGSAILTLRPDDETPDQVTQEMRQLLGDANYRLLSQYSQTQFVRVLANGLAASLYDSSTPLTAQQGEQLTQILAESDPQYKSGNDARVFPSMVNWDAVQAKAAGILSPPQLEALKNEATIISNNGVVGGLNGALPGAFGNGSVPPRGIFAPDGQLK